MPVVGASRGPESVAVSSVLGGKVAVPSCCTSTAWPSKMVKLLGMALADLRTCRRSCIWPGKNR